MNSERPETMRRIVAIGGGPFDSMAPFLQVIVDLCEADEPAITVIPTAAETAGGERKSYGLWRDILSQFTLHIRPLFLLANSPSRSEMREALEFADAVWVPGGNTDFMLRIWRRVGLDRELKRASRKGMVMSGRSAGANCWFSYSIGAEAPKATARFLSYRRNRGLGLIDSTLCTHYEDRREPFRHLLATLGGTGVGLTDGVALVVEDDSYSIFSNGTGTAYAVSIAADTGLLTERALDTSLLRRPAAELGIKP